MDYGLFRRFEKIGAATLPRTVQERGLYLVELRQCLEKETRSVPVQWQVGRSGFGEVVELVLENADRVDPAAFERDRSLFERVDPPVTFVRDESRQTVTFTIINEPPKRKHTAKGALITDEAGQLVTIFVQLS
jgi:hypothetical protein